MNGIKLPGLPTIVALMLAAMIATWLGISGALISESDARGLLNVLKDWQTLIGVVGAALIGWMAVAPVWRQVRIMGAQAASQLQPILAADLEAIDRDIAFLKEIRSIENGLGSLSANIDFWDQGDVALVDVLVKELLAIRTAITRLSDGDWGRFCDRLRLTPIQRTERAELRRVITSVRERSKEFSLRQRGSDSESRMQFLARIAPEFVRDVQQFIKLTRMKLGSNLNHHETRLQDERRRLLAKGDEIDRSLELLH